MFLPIVMEIHPEEEKFDQEKRYWPPSWLELTELVTDTTVLTAIA